MPLPQRLTFVTLGAHSVSRLREFFRSWGWFESNEGSDDFTSFTAGSVRIALYPIDRLRDEAAPGAAVPAVDAWDGMTLAINFVTKSEVDSAVDDAIKTGACTSLHRPFAGTVAAQPRPLRVL